MLDQVVFYFFAALAIVSAILVVTRRNAVQSAIFLVTALRATAGIVLNLSGEFLFIVEVIRYAGVLGVLVVVVILLMDREVAGQRVQLSLTWLWRDVVDGGLAV